MKQFIRNSFFLALLTGCVQVYGQFVQQQSVTAAVTMYLAIPDTTIITGVSSSGTPTFNDPAINSIISQYNVTDFHQAFPNAREQYMREAYRLKCSSANLGTALKSAFPDLVTYYELTGKEILAQITIYDVYGRLVLRQNNKRLGTATLNIARLASGVYFVHIRGNNGLDEEHKFIKK